MKIKGMYPNRDSILAYIHEDITTESYNTSLFTHAKNFTGCNCTINFIKTLKFLIAIFLK